MEMENREIIKGIANYLDMDFTFSQVKFLDNEINKNYESDGFYIDFSSINFDFSILIIEQDNAWDVVRERVKEIVTDTCNIPSWLEYYIDYDKLTDDSDRGETLNRYDGTEYETDNYYIYKA